MTSGPEEVAMPAEQRGSTAGAGAAEERERLFAATVELVAKRGYRNTSIDQIAAAAGIGRDAFHEHYAGKEECFLAAYDRIVEESASALALAASAAGEWPQQMAAALARLLDLIVADPWRARIALVEVQAAGPQAYARYGATVDLVAPRLREGRAYGGTAAALSETLEEAVLGGIAWIIQQRLLRGELNETEPLLGEAIQIAVGPYLGDREAKRLAAATVRQRRRQS
jgi:AcrR family transcriptional regulator